MEWHVTRPDPKRWKLQVRGTLWDGRVVKLSGHRDLKIAEKMKDNISSLNRSRQLGELPDPNLLPWINDLPERESKRLVDLGLLPPRFLDKRRPIEDLLGAFLAHSKSKCENRSVAPDRKLAKVRRVFAIIGLGAKYEDLDEDQVNISLKKLVVLSGSRKGEAISQKTRREYIFAMKSFCQWMVKKRGANKNPLEEMVAPAAKGAPVLNRRPLRAAEFAKLADYLRNAAPTPLDRRRLFTPEDRLMVYWTAVKTGFRANELRSLTRSSVDFDADPVLVTVEGWVAKNRTKATVAITDREYAKALDEYSVHRLPNTPLLRMPCPCWLTTVLYRDLDAAGVRREFDNGAIVDFHTLRSTAIYWWLREERLDLLEVQHRSRLKTLSLVQEYVRNHVPEYLEFGRKSPKGSDETASVLRAS